MTGGTEARPRGPLSAVLAAMEQGAGSLDAVAAATGLSAAQVRAAVEQLVRLGRVSPVSLAAGCASGGCGACPLAEGEPSAGCGHIGAANAAASPATTSDRSPAGPVLVAFSVRPRRSDLRDASA